MFRLLIAYYLFRGGRGQRPQNAREWARGFIIAAVVIIGLALIGKYA